MARILVVDDAAFMRNNLRRVLASGGHEIAGEAEDGNEAVQLYEELVPDAVTMDITMPNMDGIEALKQIRGKDPASKIVMCSAMGQESLVVEAITSGARDFVVKPFQGERVVEAVNKALG
jgi:two-component system chemotaxis response regulator CheY